MNADRSSRQALGTNAGLAGLGQLPSFELPAAGGGVVCSWSYRGRRALLLWLAGPRPGSAALAAAAAAEPLARREGAELVTVVQGPLEQAERARAAGGLLGPVLADVDGRIHARLGAAPAKLLVVDRSGTIYWYAPVRGGRPGFDEAVSWLEYLNILEPECGSCVPAWPME